MTRHMADLFPYAGQSHDLRRQPAGYLSGCEVVTEAGRKKVSVMEERFDLFIRVVITWVCLLCDNSSSYMCILCSPYNG